MKGPFPMALRDSSIEGKSEKRPPVFLFATHKAFGCWSRFILPPTRKHIFFSVSLPPSLSQCLSKRLILNCKVAFLNDELLPLVINPVITKFISYCILFISFSSLKHMMANGPSKLQFCSSSVSFIVYMISSSMYGQFFCFSFQLKGFVGNPTLNL